MFVRNHWELFGENRYKNPEGVGSKVVNDNSQVSASVLRIWEVWINVHNL